MRVDIDPSGKSRSLRAALAAWLLLPVLALLPLAAVLQYRLTLRPSLEALDHALGDAALALGNLVRLDAAGQVEFDLTPETERSLRTDRFDSVYYAVLNPAQRYVAGDTALASLPVPAGRAAEWRFSDGRIAGLPVRVASYLVACGAGHCEVRVAETTRKRQAAERDALLAAALPMLVLAAVLPLAIWLAIGRGLRPLSALRDELFRRSLDRLEPLDARSAPAEVAPLVDAINRLFVRLGDAALAQQAFIADAAHQLRTPLTSLRTEAELALLEPHPPALTPTLARLAASSARAARVAAQLLTLARAEAPAWEPALPVDLKDVAAECAGDWVPRALAAGIDLGFDLEPAPVMGRAVMLRELLANLLHNAIEYAGIGAHATVRTRRESGRCVLEVEDNGPGITAADRERVFERFDRGSASNSGTGSGLGLAIVRDIARSHAANVTLHDGAGGRGLTVRVSFAAA